MDPSRETILPQSEPEPDRVLAEQQHVQEFAAGEASVRGLRKYMNTWRVGRQQGGDISDIVRRESVRAALNTPIEESSEEDESIAASPQSGADFIEQRWAPKKPPQIDPQEVNLPATLREKYAYRKVLKHVRKMKAELRHQGELERTFPELVPKIKGGREITATQPAIAVADERREKKMNKLRNSAEHHHHKHGKKAEKHLGKLGDMMGVDLVSRAREAAESAKTTAAVKQDIPPITADPYPFRRIDEILDEALNPSDSSTSRSRPTRRLSREPGIAATPTVQQPGLPHDIRSTETSPEPNKNLSISDEVLDALDHEISDRIREEAHAQKDQRGVVQLPKEEFAELVAAVKSRVILEYLGEDVSEDKVKSLDRALFQLAKKRGQIKNK